MAKKLSLLLAAVALLAFAIPSIATASEATLPAGTRANVGTWFIATGNDFIFQSSLRGKITCNTLNLGAEITKNDGTTVEASGENVEPTQSGCVSGTIPWTFTTFRITRLATTTPGVATLSFASLVDEGAEVKCTFAGTNVAGTYTPGTDTLRFESASGVTGSPAACGSAKLTASFTLESTSGTALILD